MYPFVKNCIRNFYFTSVFIIVSLQLKGQTQSQLCWNEENESLSMHHSTDQAFKPDHARSLSLNLPSLKSILKGAQSDNNIRTSKNSLVIQLPMPDGTWEWFQVEESPVMHPDLATAYPFIKTYSARGIDDPTSSARLDITLFGFHSMILSSKGTAFIEPADLGNSREYFCYDNKYAYRKEKFTCNTDHTSEEHPDNPSQSAMKSSGTQLRTYRLALACTGEYASFYGGTKAGALSGMVTTINRCNGIFEQELSTRLLLIPNDTAIIYTNANSDPYTNANVSTMLTENQNNLTNTIGSANYDIGHVFSTGSGGIAGLSSVCSSGSKAKGVTGSTMPIGDAFDIDYVTHEFGHQFGARHTFNSITGFCGGGNRNGQTAYEPGSGITTMAYAGICGTDNLATHSIPYFHTISFDEITNYSTTGTGNTCSVVTGTGNALPVVTSMGSPCAIPISTPFVLTGSGIDSNQDTLTYSWEEFDLGPACPWNLPSSTSPLFRSFPPTTSPSRTIPQLSDLLSNTSSVGELLSAVPRIIKFRLTVRDQRMNGGGVMHPDTTLNITVVNNGGAFSVTSPNTAIAWGTGTTQAVTWNVSGTTNAPIHCTNVKISLSTDGGITFPIVLAPTTSNDGMELITIPNLPNTQARIKVEAVGNIFFDISNSNFIIQSSSGMIATITTMDLENKELCVEAPLTISFVADAPAGAGNVFTAQLSSDDGSFSNPMSIGTLELENSGTIHAMLPSGAIQGKGYKVRVVSSNPPVTSSDNGSTISIFGIPGPAGTIHGLNAVCQGQAGVLFSVDSILNATTYAWTLPEGASLADTGKSNSVTVNFSTSASQGFISVSGTNAGCGGISSSDLFVGVDSLPSFAGIISGPEIVCQNETEVNYSIPLVDNATGYSWTLPADAIVTDGANTNSITAAFSSNAMSGYVSVVGTNVCGKGTSSSDMEVSVNRNPDVAIISSGTTICSGESVTMNFIAEAGISYQWRKNGVDIPGATSSIYSANAAGNYDVLALTSTMNQKIFSHYHPLSIPDNSCVNSAIDSIMVDGYSSMISTADIKIKVNIIHPWVGDLDLILEAPNGNKLGLSHRAGSSNNSGDDYVNTVFSDSGGQAIPVTGAPYTGTYLPWYTNFLSCVTTTHSSFGALGGGFINPNGTWKLIVYDRAAQDTGRILNWFLSLPSDAPSICSTHSNIIQVTSIDSPTISGFTPVAGQTGSLLTISGKSFNTVTSVMINGANAVFDVINEQQIAVTIPETATSGLISVTNSCVSIQSSDSFDVLPLPDVVLNLKVFFESYYLGNGIMAPVADPVNHPTLCDTITVELRNSESPFDVMHSVTGAIDVYGYGCFNFPGQALGQAYFVVLRHNRSLETWSNDAIPLNSAFVNLDFTSR